MRTFADYMDKALYGPGGYYSSGIARSGKNGDYFTAPDVGPVFGQLLALIFLSWQERLKADPFCLVEVGAGEGALAESIGRTLQSRHCERSGPFPIFIEKARTTHLRMRWYEAICHDRLLRRASASLSTPRNDVRGIVEYIAVERSPARRRQLESLKANLPIPWRVLPDLEPLAQEPVSGVLFANELVDAFPVHRVRMKEGRLEEGYVGGACWRPYPSGSIESAELNGQGRQQAPPTIHWSSPSTPRLQSYFDRLGISLPEDYETEVNLAMADWIHDVAASLTKGLIVLIDYGRPAYEYYAPERDGGTLRAFSKHRVSDVLESGACDLTADVDFTSLTLDAVEAGLTPLAFMEMGAFLLNAIQLLAPSPPRPLALRYLLHPEGLGSAFHVLILGKGLDPSEWTFEHNRLSRLRGHRSPDHPFQ